MTCNVWLTLCSTILVVSSLPACALGQVLPLPPPPAPGATSPSDAQGTKTPSSAAQQSPQQAPIQAPNKQAEYAPQTVTCTVMVPQLTWKTITVPDVVCRPETRQKEVTVCRMVPETTMRTCVETIMVPERRTSTVPYTACRMTYETVSRQVTVMVPQTEMRQGTRTVCKPVAVQSTRTVCRDLGGWTTQCYVDRCGCQQTCRVWAPNVVTEQVPVTVFRPQYSQEPYTYQVVTCRPEQRTITQQVAKPVYETKTREVTCLVPVPKQVQRQIPQTTFRPVTENRVVNYTVMVPHRVERQVQVPVCTLVAKQVTYVVPPPCGPCAACGW